MSVDLGELLVTYNADVSGLVSNMNKANSAIAKTEETAKSSNSGIFGSFGSAIKGAVSFGAQIGQTVMGIQGLAQGAMALGSALLEPNASMEQTQVAFKQLLGSSSAATAELKDLQQFAASTPFQFPELADSTQKLLAFQFPLKATKPLLTAIGDSLSGLGRLSGASLDQVVNVFGQMKASAHLMTGDVMQLTSVGINGFQIMADQMHKPVIVIKDMISKGLIPAQAGIDMLQKGMEKTFGGGMAAQAQTFNGLLSTFQDNAGSAMRALTGPLFDAAKQGLVILGNEISSPAFQDFASGVGKDIAQVFGQIGGFISGNVVPAFHSLQPLIGQFVAYFQSDRFAEITADFQTVGNQIGRIAGAFQQAIPSANGLINGALSSLPGILQGIFEVADSVVFPLSQFLIWMQNGTPQAELVKDALIGIGVAFAAIKIGQFVATLPGLIIQLGVWAAAQWTVAAGVIATAAPFILIGAIIAVVVVGIILAIQHWGQIVEWLKSAWSNVAGFFKGLWANIVGIFGNIGGWFKDRFNDAKNAIGGAFSNLGTMMHDRGNDAKNGFQQGFGNVGNWFQTQGKNITKTSQDIATGAVQAGQWMYAHNTYWKLSVDAITLDINTAKTWIVNAWQWITTAVVNVWHWLQNKAIEVWNDITRPIVQAVSTVVSWVQGKWNAATSWIGEKWLYWSTIARIYFAAIQIIIQDKIEQAIMYVYVRWLFIHAWIMAKWYALEFIAQNAWDRVVSVFTGAVSRVTSPVTSALSTVESIFQNFAGQAFSWGANIIQGVINGIGSMFSQLGSVASGAASVVAQYLGFHSPAKKGEGAELNVWGPNLVKGFAGGIDQAAPILRASVDHLMAVGTYPIRPNVSAVSMIAAAGGQYSRSDSGTHTTIVQIDSMELARIVQKSTEKIVNLKLGPRGRVA